MPPESPAKQLDAFLAKYSPEIRAEARASLTALRKLVPGAVELVYDNYNALVIAFAASERASEAVLSIALYPKWITLFFLWGTKLDDPTKRLKGSGKQVRQVRLDDGAAEFADPAVRALIANALKIAKPPINAKAKRRIEVRAVVTKQRPRRPK